MSKPDGVSICTAIKMDDDNSNNNNNNNDDYNNDNNTSNYIKYMKP
jgi:hypothetical protein